MSIPFKQDFSMPVGKTVALDTYLCRVLAPNPSPFTYTGTQTYILGTESLTLIDPGPLMEQHYDALIEAIDGRDVEAILVTHTHLDHSPLTTRIKEATGAPVYGFGPHGSGQKGWKKGGLDKEQVEAGADNAFEPDHTLADGESVETSVGPIMALHTPGHTSNHLCFYWRDAKTLFSGDHVMGWSTTVIAPPDGNMTAYINSLERLLSLDIERMVPTHGPIIEEAKPFVSAVIEHRITRENQIIEAISKGMHQISEMVSELYKDVDKGLHPAAARSVLAHLFKLIEDGRVRADNNPGLGSRYELEQGV